MPNFKHYMNSRFSGCRLLANAYDQHRNREVKVFLIPGEFECVGVCDTVDCWIAPVIAEPFSLPIGSVIKDILDGKKVVLPINAPGSRKRARSVLLEPGDGDTPPAPEETPRRRPTRSEKQASRPRNKLIL